MVLVVGVEDQNDNSPTFVKQPFMIVVPADAQHGQIIQKVQYVLFHPSFLSLSKTLLTLIFSSVCYQEQFMLFKRVNKISVVSDREEQLLRLTNLKSKFYIILNTNFTLYFLILHDEFAQAFHLEIYQMEHERETFS